MVNGIVGEVLFYIKEKNLVRLNIKGVSIAAFKTFCICFGITSSCLGLLQFDQDVYQLNADFADTQTVVDFPFQNHTENEIFIGSVESSCGCTVPELEKYNYQPGEKGKIHIVFDHGERVGHQEKVISIHLTKPEMNTQIIKLIVNIPVILEINPKFVYWRKGDMQSREITIENFYMHPISIENVHSDTPSLITELEIVKPGQGFKLKLTPSSENEFYAKIYFKIRNQHGIERNYQVYARRFSQ